MSRSRIVETVTKKLSICDVIIFLSRKKFFWRMWKMKENVRLLLFLSLTQCAFVSNTNTNNVIRMKERIESKESQCPTHCKWIFILQNNFFLYRKMMTSQIENFLVQQSPQYKNETKRTQNIMLETTMLPFDLFHLASPC